jgi:hypothetical protein
VRFELWVDFDPRHEEMRKERLEVENILIKIHQTFGGEGLSIKAVPHSK